MAISWWLLEWGDESLCSGDVEGWAVVVMVDCQSIVIVVVVKF